MNLNSYMKNVYEDAEETIRIYYNFFNWEDMFDELCRNDGVSGRTSGCYSGESGNDVYDNVKELVWDENFDQEFYFTMGTTPDRSDPYAFDVDIRLFCLMKLHDFLRLRYEAMVVFGCTDHVDLPQRYLQKGAM